MKYGLFSVILAVGFNGSATCQVPPDDAGNIREWTNTEGKAIAAGYMGVRGSDVMLKLANGKVVGIPLAKLSVTDNAYVREHNINYLPRWAGWPSDAGNPMSTVTVSETKAVSGEFVYETSHFRFHVDGNLGAPLMKELARVFELTIGLHANSPFGILAKPEQDRFEARLFGKTDTYHNEGGPQQTAGVYLPKKKVFLAPLDMMGVRSDGNVWRRLSGTDYDTTTVVHELTHMLTHELLDKLPTWVNEGYAEYIGNIPIEANAFRVTPEKIREGVLDNLVPNHRKTDSGVTKIIRFTPSDRKKFFESGKLPSFCRVADVLTITDSQWASTRTFGLSAPGAYDYSQREALYRTSHLILYYFIQIEGEKGVEKLRGFLDENRKQMVRLDAYEEARKTYEQKMDEFMNLPGVTKLEGGRFRYPSNLKPPVAPEVPDVEPAKLKLSGLNKLLDGMTAEQLGQKIEAALVQDLGVNIKFDRKLDFPAVSRSRIMR